ncbi:MAG: lipoyl(octanoyl) transferase LipB [Phycisphaerae bacterium]|nr:lipoyl(octanoyl) transferase LipB [Phycisphaerae bacterium]
MHPPAQPQPAPSAEPDDGPPVVDLGLMAYDRAYEHQLAEADAIIAARSTGTPRQGVILLVEHAPVITVSRRPGARNNLLLPEHRLAELGIALQPTDRGGDVTYHGPGQLVVYPIIDLNHFGLRIHDYMRLLESAVIECCAGFGVAANRDPGATGVWAPDPQPDGTPAKLCAMGVRIRRWVALHGLAVNVTTDLSHFSAIVPCGLVGRPVTSFRRLLGDRCPSMSAVKASLAASLRRALSARRAAPHRQDPSAPAATP